MLGRGSMQTECVGDEKSPPAPDLSKTDNPSKVTLVKELERRDLWDSIALECSQHMFCPKPRVPNVIET